MSLKIRYLHKPYRYPMVYLRFSKKYFGIVWPPLWIGCCSGIALDWEKN